MRLCESRLGGVFARIGLFLIFLLFSALVLSCPSAEEPAPKVGFLVNDYAIMSDGDEQFADSGGQAGLNVGDQLDVRLSLEPEAVTVDSLRFEYDRDVIDVEVLPDGRSIRVTLLKKPPDSSSVSIVAYPLDATSRKALGKLNLKLHDEAVSKIAIVVPDEDEGVWNIAQGESVRLECLLEPEDASGRNVKWAFCEDLFPEAGASDNERGKASDYLILNDDGTVVGKAAMPSYADFGVCAYIDGTSGSRIVSNVVRFNVSEAPAESMMLEGCDGFNVNHDGFGWHGVSMKPGSVGRIRAVLVPETASDEAVEWELLEKHGDIGHVISIESEDGGALRLEAGGRTGTDYVLVRSPRRAVAETVVVSVVEREVDGVEVSPEALTMIVGDTLQLQASVRPDDATNANVNWRSSDESVAVVSDDGLVAAVGAGHADVIAISEEGAKIGKCGITVNPVYVSQIRLTGSSDAIKASEAIRLGVEILPENATDKSVTFFSDSERNAVVDEAGVVTGVFMGNAVITAVANDGGGASGSYAVSVAKTPVEQVIISGDSEITLKRTESLELSARVLPEAATFKNIDWVSDNPSVISVDADGRITAHQAAGSAIVRAVSGDDSLKYGEIRVNASELPIESVSLDHNDLAFETHGEARISIAGIMPAGVVVSRTEYFSSDESVAEVDSEGNIIAKSDGVCTITCRVGDNCGNFSEESCRVSVGRFVKFAFDRPGGTLRTGNGNVNWSGLLEYSTDLMKWESWDGSEIIADPDAHCIFLRGVGVTGLTGANGADLMLDEDSVVANGGFWRLDCPDGGRASVSGDIRNLLNFEDYSEIGTLDPGAFDALFYDSEALADAGDLVLAAPCSPGIYRNMFNGCQSLTAVPSLDFTQSGLTEYCYAGMFEGCASLTRTQFLKSTELAEGCYKEMYKDCVSLVKICSFSAPTLAKDCYAGMFKGCSLLRFYDSKPDMDGCYAFSFGEKPAYGALTDVIADTGGWFVGNAAAGRIYWLGNEISYVSQPQSVSVSPALTNMALGDSIRLKAKVLPFGSRQDVVWESSAPSVVSVGSDGKVMCLASGDATVSASALEGGFPASLDIHVSDAAEMKALEFSSPTIFSIETEVGKTWDGELLYSAAFPSADWQEWDGERILSGLGSDGEFHIFIRGIGNTRMASVSSHGVPSADGKWILTGTDVAANGDIRCLLDYADIDDAKMSEYCFYHLFDGCSALVRSPDLGGTVLSRGCYEGMLSGTAVTSAPVLPAVVLPAECYKDMFKGCRRLETVPDLGVADPASDCFSGMFEGCVSLRFSSKRDGEYSNRFAIGLPLSQLEADSPADAEAVGAMACNMLKDTAGEYDSDPVFGSVLWTANRMISASEVTVRELSLSATSSLLEVMQKISLAHSVLPENATNQLVVWSSDNPAVATVSRKGIVSGISPGTAVITASLDDGSLQAQYEVMVSKSDCVEFISPSGFSIRTANLSKNWNGTIQYRTADGGWTTWDGSVPIAAMKADGDDRFRLFMRGSGNSILSGPLGSGVPDKRWIIDGGNVDCAGDMANLLDFDSAKPGNMDQYCFAGLFYGCDALISAPSLSMMSLSDDCYHSMFENCTNLMLASELPAMDLKPACYMRMFSGCSSLVAAARTLPALSAVDYCYEGMFSGCSSLVDAPSFVISNAEVQAQDGKCVAQEGVARGMFQDCASLKRVDAALSAPVLGNAAYYEMFSGCVSLENAPEIGAVSIGKECMYRMFCDCRSLKEAPYMLSAESLHSGGYPGILDTKGCYQEMFSGCVSLETPPIICATSLASMCFGLMFENCKSLNKLPAIVADVFPVRANNACEGMFKGCSSIKLLKSRTSECSNGFRIPRMENPTASITRDMFYGTCGDFAKDGTAYHNAVFYTSNEILWPYDLDGFSIEADSKNGNSQRIAVGESLQLAIRPSRYGMNPKVVWESLDEKTAEVDQNGCVIALAEGTAAIKAISPSGAMAVYEIQISLSR